MPAPFLACSAFVLPHPRRRGRLRIAALLAALAPALLTAAQESTPLAGDDTPPPPKQGPGIGDVQFSARAFGEHQFKVAVDGGGEMDLTRAGTGIGIRTQLSEDTGLSIQFGYTLDAYDFDGTTVFGATDPWDDVHSIGIRAVLSKQIDDRWGVFGGPMLRAARERDADWDDAWTWGGALGASLRVDDDLTIGAGIAVMSDLQDSARIFPIITVDWEITNTLKLTNSGGGGSGIGVELVYDLGDGWETGIGAGYRFNRFRLNDEGVAPLGVGEEEALPIRARLSYRSSPNMQLSVYAGFVIGGALELEQADGVVIRKEDYDPAGLLGLSASFRF